MNMLTQGQLAEIRERAEKATPGPWEELRGERGFTIVSENDGEVIVDPLVGGVQFGDDADFIASARIDIPLLLAHIEELIAGFAQEVEAHAATNKENQRFNDLVMKNVMLGASYDQLKVAYEAMEKENQRRGELLIKELVNDALQAPHAL